MSKRIELLNMVAAANEFYKKRIKEYQINNPTDITQYPVLTRQDLQKHRYNMFTDGYKLKYFTQLLRRQSSSGSSGIPVHVYWDQEDYSISMLSLWRLRMKYYKISPSNKAIKFVLADMHMASDNKEGLKYYQESSSVIYVNRMSLYSEEQYMRLVALMDDYKPEWLYIQPSVLRKLLLVCRRYQYKLPDTIRYIESVGELLDDILKREAREYFKVPVVNMYGSEEMNGIAYECPYHNMHILEQNVYVEVKNGDMITDSGEGEAIITNIRNRAMPLIRYNQGDRIRIKKQAIPCACGEKAKVIEVIYGREQNSYCIGSFEMNSFVLTGLISEINNRYFDMIHEFRFEYFIKPNTLRCYVGISGQDGTWFANISESIKKACSDKIPEDLGMRFEVWQEENRHSYKKNQILEVREE